MNLFKTVLTLSLLLMCIVGFCQQDDTIKIRSRIYAKLEDMIDATLKQIIPGSDVDSFDIVVMDGVTLYDNILDLDDLRLLNLKSKGLMFKVTNSKIAGDFTIVSKEIELQLRKVKIRTLSLQSDTLKNVVITNCIIDSLLLNGSKIKNLLIQGGRFKYISLTACKDVESLTIGADVHITALDLCNFNPKAGDMRIKISSPFRHKDSAYTKLLVDAESNFEKINIDYANFTVEYQDFVTDGNADAARASYIHLLNKFAQSGQTDNELRLYRHKRKFEANQLKGSTYFDILVSKVNTFFTYTIPDWWWGFGYEKQKVFRNTLILFMICVGLGIFRYRSLAREYPIIEDQELIKAYSTKRSAKIYVPVIAIAILFFGVEFKPNKLKFKKFLYSFAIIGIYFIGLVCLGFLANLVITK